MTFYRITKQSKFTQIDNRMITDSSISAKAKGLMLYLLSKPDGWKVYETDIIKHMKDGRDSVRSGIKELVKEGYIDRQQAQGEGGKFAGYTYQVFEWKGDNPAFSHVHRVGLSVDGKTDNGKPPTNNTNSSNTDLSNTLKDIVEPTATTTTRTANQGQENETLRGIIRYLNIVTDRKFKETTAKTHSLLRARFNEGYSLDDMKYVIDNKSKEWRSTAMSKYLRPETLFGSKFEGYVNEPKYQDVKNNVAAVNDMMKLAAEMESVENGKIGNNESVSDDTNLLPF